MFARSRECEIQHQHGVNRVDRSYIPSGGVHAYCIGETNFLDKAKHLVKQYLFFVWTVSFINRKWYKPVLQAEGGFRARVQLELCGLPTSNYYASALPCSTRRLPLFMELPR
jgi:hypothetical protein